VLEAMAVGRPVVAAASGGIVDMVEDGVTGRLVEPADPQALAKALADVLALPDQGHAMGLAGRQAVEAFTAGRIVPRIEDAYIQLLGDRTYAVRPLGSPDEAQSGGAA